jgi:RNA polymerase sigma factor (sigma-70 family)
MATVPTSPLVRCVRHIAAVSAAADSSDAALLERFVCLGDEAAFAALVRRHGPLVLGACRRVLGDWHLAQDCFQVTFLVLARKAGSLRRPDALGPWLHGVATRTARKARAQIIRRRCKERQIAVPERTEDGEDVVWRDLRRVLDESVAGLPERYRLPFVLHYLQGVTVSEVARRLGWPRGTVATRLARARERLRARLSRHDPGLSAGCLLGVLSEAAPPGLPASLILPTTTTALLTAAGQAVGPGLLSARAIALMEGGFRSMKPFTIKMAVALLVVAALMGAGAGLFSRRGVAANGESTPESAAATKPERSRAPAGPAFRFLSLAEARALALEKVDLPLDELPWTAETERTANQAVLNAEVAYWNLYGAWWTLHSREQGLRLAFDTFQRAMARYPAGKATAADFQQARGQYELFRAQRLQAIDTVLENERQLREVLGLAVEDGSRLVPGDAPTTRPCQPDWKVALEEALAKRPEIRMARQDVKAAMKDSERARKGGLPVPPLHMAFLHLARTKETLKDQELKAQRFLARYYRQLSTDYETIRAQRAQREAFGEQLRARQQEFLAGRGTLDILLEAQRFWADALANEYTAIVSYNNSLAGFEFGKGAILAHAKITPGKEVRAAAGRKAARFPAGRMQGVPVERLLAAPPLNLPALWKRVPPLEEAPTTPIAPGQAGP